MNKINGLKNFGRTTSHQREALPSPIETGQPLRRPERPSKAGRCGENLGNAMKSTKKGFIYLSTSVDDLSAPPSCGCKDNSQSAQE